MGGHPGVSNNACGELVLVVVFSLPLESAEDSFLAKITEDDDFRVEEGRAGVKEWTPVVVRNEDAAAAKATKRRVRDDDDLIFSK